MNATNYQIQKNMSLDIDTILGIYFLMIAIIVIFLPSLEGDKKVLVMPPLEADEKEVKEKREMKVLKCKQDINQAFNIKAGNNS